LASSVSKTALTVILVSRSKLFEYGLEKTWSSLT